jgi:hypothetical protein
MPDQEIKCAERGCEQTITFSERDQDFYAEKGWPPPKRCKEHREAKKRRIEGLQQGQQ